jgi:hypothetical protein
MSNKCLVALVIVGFMVSAARASKEIANQAGFIKNYGAIMTKPDLESRG